MNDLIQDDIRSKRISTVDIQLISLDVLETNNVVSFVLRYKMKMKYFWDSINSG